jgi:hypothetical protein
LSAGRRVRNRLRAADLDMEVEAVVDGPAHRELKAKSPGTPVYCSHGFTLSCRPCQ